MKKSINLISPKDRQVLALWYDTESYKVLRKLIDHERLELAKDHVDEIDMMQIRHKSGQISSLKKLIGTLTDNYKEHIKNEEKTQKHNKR